MLYTPFLLVLTELDGATGSDQQTAVAAVPSHDFTCCFTKLVQYFYIHLTNGTHDFLTGPCWINMEKMWELCHEPQWV